MNMDAFIFFGISFLILIGLIIILLIGITIVVVLQTGREIMDEIKAAVTALEETNVLVLAKIAELKAAGDPAALAELATRINTANQALKDAIA